jgi:hypothetical protein
VITVGYEGVNKASPKGLVKSIICPPGLYVEDFRLQGMKEKAKAVWARLWEKRVALEVSSKPSGCPW